MSRADSKFFKTLSGKEKNPVRIVSSQKTYTRRPTPPDKRIGRMGAQTRISPTKQSLLLYLSCHIYEHMDWFVKNKIKNVSVRVPSSSARGLYTNLGGMSIERLRGFHLHFPFLGGRTMTSALSSPVSVGGLEEEPSGVFASRVRALALSILAQALSDVEGYIRFIDQPPASKKCRMRVSKNGRLYRDPRGPGYMLKRQAAAAMAWFGTPDFELWLGLAGVRDYRKKFLHQRVQELRMRLVSAQ